MKITHTLKPLSVDEAATFLNLKPSTIYKYVRHNTIPFARKKRMIYFFADELISWLKESSNKMSA